jgi:hypothetical protein
MRFSPATRLTDRQTIWIAYKNDGSQFNRITPPWGTTSTVWAAQYAEQYEEEAMAKIPTFEH